MQAAGTNSSTSCKNEECCNSFAVFIVSALVLVATRKLCWSYHEAFQNDEAGAKHGCHAQRGQVRAASCSTTHQLPRLFCRLVRSRVT